MKTTQLSYFFYVEQYVAATGYVLGRRDVTNVEVAHWPYIELEVAVHQPETWGFTRLFVRTVMYTQPMPEKAVVRNTT